MRLPAEASVGPENDAVEREEQCREDESSDEHSLLHDVAGPSDEARGRYGLLHLAWRSACGSRSRFLALSAPIGSIVATPSPVEVQKPNPHTAASYSTNDYHERRS